MAPKSNKKPAKNAFYFFMIDVRQDEEAKGRRFHGLKDVADFAGPLWRELSFEVKQSYNEKAKKLKGVDNDGRNKFTSLGVSYATIDAEARELEEANTFMLHIIRTTVRSLDRKSTLLTQKFHLCHVNYFYKTENNFYSAAEIALSEFNLKDGLIDKIQFFIDPGRIPLGYRFEAKDWSAKTHGIPVGDWEDADRDYSKIYHSLRAFLLKGSDDNTIPPIYTMPDSLNSNMCLSAVKSAFTTLCEAAAENPNQFRVYPFPHLFYEIRNKCVETDNGVNVSAQVPSVAIVENEIEKDVFSYAKNLGCSFHEKKDLSLHCSLSIVVRWVYTICDHCCKHVGVRLELGKHCPKDADINWAYKCIRAPENRLPAAVPCDENNSKEKNSFMPTIIDHGRLKEIREKQLLEDQKTFKMAERVRPPKNINPTVYGVGRGRRENISRNINVGRGSRNNEYPVDEGPAWPVSGRGRMVVLK